MSLRQVLVFIFVAALPLSACNCDKKGGGGGPLPSGRCEVDLAATGLFNTVGNTARAKVIQGADELIGGQAADGRVGDVLLSNERIRVVISQPGRQFAVAPYGGWIVDADLQRAAGEAGRDQFGRIGLFYDFGRTINGQQVDILDDGSGGGPAIVAVTGKDVLSDFVDLNSQIENYLPAGTRLTIDPNAPVPVKATTYYVLSPGETRVRVLTQFCNEGSAIVSMPVGELIDQGGSVEFFNPEGCAGQMGKANCLIDPTHGFAWQGEGVAYGYRSYRFDDMHRVADDAVLSVEGITGLLASAEDSSGMLSWMDPNASRRPGTFGIRPGESRGWLRDFFVAKDLGDWTSTLTALDGASSGRLKVTVKDTSGAVAPGARVAVFNGSRMVTLLVADKDGQSHADIAPGTYDLYVGEKGHALEAPVQTTVGTNGTQEETLTLGPSRTLTVTVKDPFGAPMPAKVTVLCPSGTCPTPASALGKVAELEVYPSDVAAIGFVPPSGQLALKVPPGQYSVVVTRGPEYSAWPSSWPNGGEPVDLTSADQVINPVLSHVVDSTGWMSADLHVHAVNSPDSNVANEERVLSFLGEGVDILVSTDHDFITDYAPIIHSLGGDSVMASMIGSEISSFNFGHFNAYPMVLRDEVHGGPFDWAGGDGATLSARQIFAGVHEQHPDAIVQINHGRGSMGALTRLGVDTDTFQSHVDPKTLRMDVAQDATATDTKLFNDNFDAFEIANGLTASTALLNDWMTMLSSGRRKTATGVSDTHNAYQVLGGYSRTMVQLGTDDPTKFDAKAFAGAIRAMKASGTNGPFLRVTATKVDSNGAPLGSSVGMGETVSVNPAAQEAVELTIDVQAPEWMRFDTLEVFTHADGREALNGESNNTWPLGLEKSIPLDSSALPVEAVPDQNGQNFNRVHVVEKVTVTPSADTWYVVILRSSSAVNTLYPLAYDGVTCSGALCTAKAGRPYAFTNPVFVDADGSGAYDHFPQKVTRAVRLNRAPKPPAPLYVPTVEELNAAIRKASEHKHE